MMVTTERYASAEPILDVDPPLPDNSELKKIARDTLAAVKYSFAVVASNPTRATRAGALEAAFAEALASMREETRQRYEATSRRLLASDDFVRQRVFGRYGAIAPDRVREIGFRGLREAAGPLALDRKLLGLPETARDKGALNYDKLEAVFGPMTVAPGGPHVGEAALPPLRFLSTEPDPEVPFPGYWRKLEFKVRWLKCDDETNPEWPGSDEIGIGGVSVHGGSGETKKIGPKTYEDFDDGNKEWFSPHWVFASFERTKPKSGQWVYDTYGVGVSLAELDAGSFGNFLDKIYTEVKEEVAAAIIGGVIIGTTPAIGSVLGPIAAWVANELIEWFIDWFEDDPLGFKHATLTTPRGLTLLMPNEWTYEAGGARSKERDLHFYGGGGHYSVRYYWRFGDWVNGSAPQ